MESGAVASDSSSDGVTGSQQIPNWMNLLAQLAASGARSSPMIAVVDQ